jgi:hypothetical protein
MTEYDDLIESHAFDFEESMAGFSWVCSCGTESDTDFPRRDQAERDVQRHLADALGVKNGPVPGQDREFGLMVRLLELGSRVEIEDIRDQSPDYGELMGLLASLHKRGFISIERPLYGDNRLMGAHGISLSHEGRGRVEDMMRAATDIREGAEPDSSDESPRISSFPDIEATRRGRAEFTGRLYQQARGSTSDVVEAAPLGFQLGWDRRLTAAVVQYLTGEGLVMRPSFGAVSITHRGVKEVEDLQMEPEKRTEHFSPVTNIVTVYGNNSGQIQTGTTSSSQNQVVEASHISQFLDVLEAALGQARDVQAATTVGTTIDLIRESLEADGPDAPLVRRLLPGLSDFAINLAASGTFLGLTEAVTQLPPFG